MMHDNDACFRWTACLKERQWNWCETHPPACSIALRAASFLLFCKRNGWFVPLSVHLYRVSRSPLSSSLPWSLCWQICPNAKIFIDFHGNMIAEHIMDRQWTVDKFLASLQSRKLSWRQIFWRVPPLLPPFFLGLQFLLIPDAVRICMDLCSCRFLDSRTVCPVFVASTTLYLQSMNTVPFTHKNLCSLPAPTLERA